MKRTASMMFCAFAVVLLAMPALAQQYSCSKMEWPDQIASIYENIAPACVETVEIDGKRYGRFEGTFLTEHAGEVTLRFGMPDGNTVVQTFRPPEDFRVRVDGEPRAFHELERGQAVTIMIPEQD